MSSNYTFVVSPVVKSLYLAFPSTINSYPNSTMRSAFRIFLGLVLLIVIIILSVVSADSTRARKNKQGGSAVCDCRYSSDSPVCASNGVTYPNNCRFECAKRKVRRLRVVSSGSCRGKSLQDYRRNQRGSRHGY